MFMREFQSNFFDLVFWCPLGHIGTSGGIRTHVTSALEVRYSSAELHPYFIGLTTLCLSLNPMLFNSYQKIHVSLQPFLEDCMTCTIFLLHYQKHHILLLLLCRINVLNLLLIAHMLLF